MNKGRYIIINAILWGIAIIGTALIVGKESPEVSGSLTACAGVSIILLLSTSYKWKPSLGSIMSNAILWAGAIAASSILITKNLLYLLLLLIPLALLSTLLLIKGMKMRNP